MDDSNYNWFKIANKTAQKTTIIPEGKVIKFHIQGKALFLTHKNGKYYAGDNRCPHAGALMSGGWLNENGDIVCPYHRYCFSLHTGRTTSGEGYYLPMYPVQERADGWYVGFKKRKWFEFW